MIPKRIQSKGILVKILERVIRVLLIKTCKKIGTLKIDIVSSSAQIIKGEIQKINLIAEDINYKDLLFDGFELEANHFNLNYNSTNKKLYFKNNPKIKFKISISQNSLREILLSDNWNWIENMIRKEILNHEKLEDIRIKNGKLLMKTFEKNIIKNQGKQINIKAERGRIYLLNKNFEKSIQIPIEEKIYIDNVKIENDLINIFGNSNISF